LAVLAFGALGAAAASADSLYIGDQTDNTIQSFDATGNPLGTFIPAPTGVIGPRGILHLSNGHFLVAYQNPGQPFPGEIDQFAQNGVSLGPLVPSSNPNAPFAPRGIILGPDGRTLYVADFGAGNIGAVERYDVVTGQFLGDLTFDSFINSSASNGEFHPRGLPVAMISERK
jgi:DNA-binding beta-propeller fold protein YncE